MTEQNLEILAMDFLGQWQAYQAARGAGIEIPFEKWQWSQKFITLGFIASHVNPHPAEYAIHHKYAGCAFFTGNGELVFTEEGLPFAKKVCDLYRKQGYDMQVIKVEY